MRSLLWLPRVTSTRNVCPPYDIHASPKMCEPSCGVHVSAKMLPSLMASMCHPKWATPQSHGTKLDISILGCVSFGTAPLVFDGAAYYNVDLS
jgi:hypothetical protein